MKLKIIMMKVRKYKTSFIKTHTTKISCNDWFSSKNECYLLKEYVCNICKWENWFSDDGVVTDEEPQEYVDETMELFEPTDEWKTVKKGNAIMLLIRL